MSLLIALSYMNAGLAGSLSVGILLLLLPIGAWYVLALLRPAERILWLYTRSRRWHEANYYLETSPRRVAGVERRTVELLLPVLGISAYAAKTFTTVTPGSGLALSIFLAFAIVELIISPLFLITIWVYEDSGFRTQSISNTTVGVPFTFVKRVMVYGGLIAYLSFSSTLAGSLAGALVFTGTLLFFVAPLCYFISTMFHDKLEPSSLEKFRSFATLRGFPLKSMKIV